MSTWNLEINKYYYIPRWKCLFYVLKKEPNRKKDCYCVLYIDDWITKNQGTIDTISLRSKVKHVVEINLDKLSDYVQPNRTL